jgi:hypothetical protein
MASRSVTEYMALVATTQGEAAARQAWKRVQAGFALSRNIDRAPEASGPNPTLNAKIMDIFLAKSAASRGVHEQCPMTIGGRTLSTWLDPAMLRQPEWRVEFLQSLANAKPWVHKGDSGRSRLVQQLCWGGSMFGAFTDREVAVVREWVDSLAGPGAEGYTAFKGREMTACSPAPVKLGQGPDATIDLFDKAGEIQPYVAHSPSSSISDMDVSKLQVHEVLPLWFVHSCLLESAVSVPWKVATPAGCAIVRLLRAQYGFLPEPAGVDGLDEMSREDHVDLVDIGMEMVSRAFPQTPVPEDIEHALKIWPSAFAEQMLKAAMRPLELRWMLLGITKAFTELHDVVSSSDLLLSAASRAALRLISKRERESLKMCVADLVQGSAEMSDYKRGYQLGVRQIGLCFGQ